MATHKSATIQRKEDESSCPVCHERMEIFAVGRCDHTICFRCAVRMRVLCDQMYCAICRTDLLQVLFLRRRQKFETVDMSEFCVNRQYRIFSEDASIDLQYRCLLEHRCKLCLSIEPFETFQNLREHMQREHTLFYCDLCVNNLKLFTVDRRYYSRAQLGHHRRLGDDDDRSYKGHPLCKFCEERYFDNDDLLRHLRKQHFYCHFCESDGITNEYFSDYVLLREHFNTAHVLCEEGECRHAEFTNAFRSNIDYRAHWTQKHSAGVGRQQARQMRQIDISVDFGTHDGAAAVGDARSHRGSHQRGSGRRVDSRDGGAKNSRMADTNSRQGARERREVERKRREEIDQAHALSASLADVQRQGHISVIDRQLAQHPMMKSESSAAASSEPTAKYQGRPEDFPTLDGLSQSALPAAKETQPKPDDENHGVESGPPREMSLAKKLALSSRLSVRNGPVDLADFPSLPDTKQTKTRKGPSMSAGDFPSLSSISQAKLSKTSTASVWNAGSKSSVVPVQPSSCAEKLEDSRRKNCHDDFPSLMSTASASDRTTSLPANLPSRDSLASISRNLSSGSLAKMVNPAETTSDSSSLSWGPELNRKSGNQQEKKELKDNFLHMKSHKSSCKSTVREACGVDSGRLPVSELSSRVKQADANSNISDKSTVVSTKASVVPSKTAKATRENDEQTYDVLMAGSTDWTKVGGENKTEFRPSKKKDAKPPLSNASSDVQADSKKTTKSSGKTVDSSFKSKNDKEKLKKKQKVNKPQREPRAETTSSEDAEKKSVKSAIVVDSQKSESENADIDPSDKRDLSKAAEKLAGDDSVQSSEKQNASNGGCSITTVNGEVTELVAVANTNPTDDVTPLSDVATPVPVFTADDFPSLSVHQLAPSSLPSLPPGFSSLTASSTKPPPPGFANPEVPCCPPPGLKYPSLHGDDVDKTGAVVDSEVKSSTFIPPQDMQQRMDSFVSFISTAVKDGRFEELHDLSAKFRAGNISADEYHSGFCDMLDPAAFLSIFPELIALLPDLPKQQQLLKVHRDFLSKSETRHGEKTRAWCSAPDDGLVSCTVCGQVLRHSDLHHHSLEHATFNTEYPTLPNNSVCSVR